LIVDILNGNWTPERVIEVRFPGCAPLISPDEEDDDDTD
jgi:hypothetical protein